MIIVGILACTIGALLGYCYAILYLSNERRLLRIDSPAWTILVARGKILQDPVKGRWWVNPLPTWTPEEVESILTGEMLP